MQPCEFTSEEDEKKRSRRGQIENDIGCHMTLSEAGRSCQFLFYLLHVVLPF